MKRFSELSIPVCLPTLVPPRLPDRQALPANRAADPAHAPAACRRLTANGRAPRKPCRVG
jgi:hypothetical protein